MLCTLLHLQCTLPWLVTLGVENIATCLKCSGGYAEHILTYSYGDPGFGSCVSGDTELVHVHDPVIVTYTTRVSLRYYLRY